MKKQSKPRLNRGKQESCKHKNISWTSQDGYPFRSCDECDEVIKPKQESWWEKELIAEIDKHIFIEDPRGHYMSRADEENIYIDLRCFIRSLLSKEKEKWVTKLEKIVYYNTDKSFGTVDYKGIADDLINLLKTK